MEEFNTFNEIEHMPLRVYNRSVMAFNIAEDNGQHRLEEYLNKFDDKERMQIYLMINYIRKMGAKAAHDFATKDLVLEDEVA